MIQVSKYTVGSVMRLALMIGWLEVRVKLQADSGNRSYRRISRCELEATSQLQVLAAICQCLHQLHNNFEHDRDLLASFFLRNLIQRIQGLSKIIMICEC